MTKKRRPSRMTAAPKSAQKAKGASRTETQQMLDALRRLEASASYRGLDSPWVFARAAVDTAAQVADASKPAPDAAVTETAPTQDTQPTTVEVVAALASQTVAEPVASAEPTPVAAPTAAHEIEIGRADV